MEEEEREAGGRRGGGAEGGGAACQHHTCWKRVSSRRECGSKEAADKCAQSGPEQSKFLDGEDTRAT